jgi:hypothetical protein
MSQLPKIQPRLVALHDLRPTRRLADRRRRLGQAKQAIQLREHADGTQPHGTVGVEFGKEAEFEVANGRVAVLARFFEGADRRLELGD